MPIDLSRYEATEPSPSDYDGQLALLQEQVSRLFVANHVHGRKAVIVCEGWDAAGKGGAIQRLTAKCDPRHVSVWPIGAPTPEEKAHHYLWRFWRRLPGAGEVAIFDRSWYGRVLVERVEGFAAEAAWRRAYGEINAFEAQLSADGTIIVKLFFHVRQDVQDARLRARIEHPWKRWKISVEDFRNRARRGDYLAAIKDMFAATNTIGAPWRVINGNNKQAARLATLRQVADALAQAVLDKPPAFRPGVEHLAQVFLQSRD